MKRFAQLVFMVLTVLLTIQAGVVSAEPVTCIGSTAGPGDSCYYAGGEYYCQCSWSGGICECIEWTDGWYCSNCPAEQQQF